MNNKYQLVKQKIEDLKSEIEYHNNPVSYTHLRAHET